MSIRLRPHHLLCMLAYSGKGYTDAFVANYDTVMARLNGREEIRIVSGPDDICTALLGAVSGKVETGFPSETATKPETSEPDCHCHNQSILARDADAAAEVSKRLGRPIAEGETLVVDHATLAILRAGFKDGSIRTACGAYESSAACEWHALCSEIAAHGFRSAKLSPPRHDE
jgi:uncharacterized protein